MSTFLFESGYVFKDTEGVNNTHDQEDLMLAAELGKSLLERNRELDAALRATQEYAEEKCAQAEFYLKQVEILRDENEMNYHTCEQLEANNQMLSDKCIQWKAEFKLLEGKNSRLWEVINSLEKRIEELTSELDTLKSSLGEMDDAVEEGELLDEEMYNRTNDIRNMHNKTFPLDSEEDLCTNMAHFELEREFIKKQISELHIQVKLIKLQKDEMECQLEDVVNENQVLYNKISTLKQEVVEWENFAQKEENYRRLAATFTLKHFIVETESDIDIGNIFEKRQVEENFRKGTLTRAKSCECLSSSDGNIDFLKSPNLVNNILSSVNSGSFLSELDTEYSALVKRYEALLEKYKQEGKLKENPDRTKKVQKAIQTLSLDFSNIPTLPILVSPQKEKTPENSRQLKNLSSVSCGVSVGTPKCENNFFSDNAASKDSSTSIISSPDYQTDYREMFSQIFAKLHESKEASVM